MNIQFNQHFELPLHLPSTALPFEFVWIDAGSFTMDDDFPPIGFRVCLRPITAYDLNDGLLKERGIHILGG